MNTIKLPENLVNFKLIVSPEDRGPEDDFEDKETVAWIHNQLARNNEYAWFFAEVQASYGEISVSSYLGANSYESKKSFLASEGFADMKREALDLLNEKLNHIHSELEKLAHPSM